MATFVGLMTCKEVTRIRYERLEGKTVRFDEHTPHNIGVPRRDVDRSLQELAARHAELQQLV